MSEVPALVHYALLQRFDITVLPQHSKHPSFLYSCDLPWSSLLINALYGFEELHLPFKTYSCLHFCNHLILRRQELFE